MKTQRLFAYKHAGVLYGFYPNAWLTSTCSTDREVYAVELVEDASGDYWTWYDAEGNEFLFTNSHRPGVEICFPYGTRPLAERGAGVLMTVRANVLRKLEPHEYKKDGGLVGDARVRDVP